ncbi:hypothetical protein RUMHYD_02775 [Blautia hydrogenotrophica DSM 10507]|uniref:Uncharacterized protein n=1 Tax=Blautia hydrogenotrophica (strain DSM 10507 / JCM 14656 / S5a33) TaxID=476272 RepID=C0CPH4_BLAHS|nr:hypothetical protein RUMHYD_02775 [Blautia hydrogenotrophica DSM 10507]
MNSSLPIIIGRLVSLLFLLMKKNKKKLAFFRNVLYTHRCCDMIAVKREVAVHCGRFSVERMSS